MPRQFAVARLRCDSRRVSPRACALALDERLVAAILHGSLTLGDYVPNRSDGDLLVVVEDPSIQGHAAALEAAFAEEAESALARVDVRVVTRHVAAAPTPAPPLELTIVRSADGQLLVRELLATTRARVAEARRRIGS